MRPEPLLLALGGAGYLLLTFGIAWMAERRLLPRQLLEHPVVYVLSLGVYVSAFGIYGITGYAAKNGASYLAYYVGMSAAFILAPLLLRPLMVICGNYRLNSLADLMTFRYRSQMLGSLTTVVLTLGMMPLFAMQIDAISRSGILLMGRDAPLLTTLPLLFCAAIAVFAVLFGSRHLNTRESHRGLVAAIAFSTLFKVSLFLLAGAIAIYGVFDGPESMSRWLGGINAPDLPASNDESMRMLLVLFFACSVCMPHMFHMQFAENPRPNNMRPAQWGMPLLMLLMSLPVMPILWAAQFLEEGSQPEFALLTVALAHSEAAAAAMFTAGVATASGVLIVSSIALASMWLNHILLPLFQPRLDSDIYQWLLQRRRALIVGLIFAGYLFHMLMPRDDTMIVPGAINLLILGQFIPGIVCALYWQKASAPAVIAGILSGCALAVMAAWPLANGELSVSTWAITQVTDTPAWILAALVSLAGNILALTIISLLVRQSDEQKRAAEACSLDDLNRPQRHFLAINSISGVRHQLGRELGDAVAGRELARAMGDIDISYADNKPATIRRLRDQLSVNLSALMGPSAANDIIDRAIPLDPLRVATNRTDINRVESRLERGDRRLTGIAADLDTLRRYHRQTLNMLPIGLLAISDDGEILLWNKTMESLTGITSSEVTGALIADLAQPWQSLLQRFFESQDNRMSAEALVVDDSHLWLNLLKTGGNDPSNSEQLIVIEDITDTRTIEQQLAHQERLASIGRLAAGVAHEIGNPVTGIACLAQNLRLDTNNPESLESAEQILQQTHRITTIVQSLVNFTHMGNQGEPQPRTPVDPLRCAREAIKLLQLDRDAPTMDYRLIGDSSPLVLADEQRLVQVLINLLTNARDASEPGSTIEIATAETATGIELSVIDSGTGIPEEILDRLFEPFFTTKDPGKGTGLGLSLVYRFVHEFGGDLRAESPVEAGRGSRFVIRLDRTDERLT